MIARRAIETLLAAMILAVAGATIAAAPSRCTLVRVAEWPVRPVRGQPIVEGTINAQKVGILVDTGATSTMVLRSAAVRLGLVRRGEPGSALGIGGETAVESALVEELTIGDAVRKNWVMLVAGERDLGPGVAVILGEDFFGQADVEFDLGHNTIRLFQPRDCEGAPLGYWAAGANVVEIEGGGAQRAIAFAVAINGRSVPAILDSGAYSSVVTKSQAAEVGVTPDSPGVVAGGCSVGIGRKPIEFWFGTFETFRIGDEVIHDPKIRFADLWKYSTLALTGSLVRRRPIDRPEMLLGADFLRSHRVLVAHSQRKMYFTYEGGTVFPSLPSRACDDLQRRDPGTMPAPASERGKG